MSVTMELPRISIKTDVKKAEARPFVGKVVADAIGPAKFDNDGKTPYQWTIGVQPLKSADGTKGFQIGGRTGAFWVYPNISAEVLEGEIKEQTKFGRHYKAFKEVFGSEDDRAIGRGEYVNEIAWFKKDKIQFGTNKQTGEPIESDILIPVRLLTEEEMVEYGLAVGAAPTNVDLSDEELSALADALDGTDRNALQKRVYQAKLGNKLAQAVGKGDGPAIKALVERGLATFDGDTLRKAA